jgi:flavin-dependent dehydrogenase
MPEVEFLVVGCGPAGGIAAREAAREGVETLVLERDATVGPKRVCAAGLRPGFCEDFDVPRGIVHFDVPFIALHAANGKRYDFPVGPAHTTTREELDGAIADLARGAGAEIRTSALYRSANTTTRGVEVEYADGRSGERRTVTARHVFMANGSSARFEGTPFAYEAWRDGLITCYQYRVYPERRAAAAAYQALEMHYYASTHSGRNVIAWMFPKRDHLSIGLGIMGKIGGAELRSELDAFMPSVQRRLFAGVPYTVRVEGNLLYGGLPRPVIGDAATMVGGTAAGLVDATTGEGIHEAAASGRFAAAAVVAEKRGKAASAPLHYAKTTKRAFFGRLHHRHKLMTFLERRPWRFEVLFDQLERTPKFAELLQHDRNDFSPAQWLYLYAQAARFSLRAVRAGK